MEFTEERKKGENTKDYLYRVLKKKIMQLELEPGCIVSENEIVKSLNISRTPIREILKRLESENLVEIIPQTGTKVTKIDENLIDQVLFMRTVLEKEIVKELQKTVTEEGLMELRNIISLQGLYRQKDMMKEFHKADNDFHEKIYDLASKNILWDTINSLSGHYGRARMLNLMQADGVDADKILSQHKNIVKLIEDKASYDEIEKALAEHILEPSKHWNELFIKLGFEDYIKKEGLI